MAITINLKVEDGKLISRIKNQPDETSTPLEQIPTIKR